MCSTTLVTTSETSRQARSACSSSIPHCANVSNAILLASDTLIGSAGYFTSQVGSSSSDVLITRMAMSSSIWPGTACSAAWATRSTLCVATDITALVSMPKTSSSS